MVNIPDTVDFDDREALMAIASRLYEKGKLSVGQAAELVGLSKSAFMEILTNYGVSVFNYPSSGRVGKGNFTPSLSQNRT